MKFELSEEQAGFGQSLSDLLEKADTVAVARAWAEGDTAPGLALWRRLADQGVNALAVAEEAGGLGASLVDLTVAHQVLGHHLAVGPWIEATAFLPHALAGDKGVGAEALGALAEGQVATVAAAPLAPRALDGDIAEAVYVATPAGVVTGTAGEIRESVDVTRRLAEVDGATDATVDISGRFAEAFDAAALACAAQLLGCGERILAETVAYAQQRRQFGREIGSYQAIKHQLADVRIALDFVGPLVHGAALGDVPVSAAKVYASDAAYLASRVGLQVHGAIGYTRECDLSLWLGRVRALVTAWGTPSYHRARLADQIVRAG